MICDYSPNVWFLLFVLNDLYVYVLTTFEKKMSDSKTIFVNLIIIQLALSKKTTSKPNGGCIDESKKGYESGYDVAERLR